MKRSIANESPHPTARRLGAGALALAVLLGLGACKAAGGGYIGEPMDGGLVSEFQSQARFGFTYSCDMTKDNRAEIRGQITYHDDASIVAGVEFPEMRLHGTVDSVPVEGVMSCAEAAEVYEGLSAARFDGTYRSQDDPLGSGRFTVLVFDQREPGRSVGEITGDGFSIELFGGAYDGYTRAGYLEGGNIQVK